MASALPRLLSVKAAAQYCGVSAWTVRDWILAGHLHPVDLPARPPRPGERQRRKFRRILLDRRALDAFIDGRSGSAQGGA